MTQKTNRLFQAAVVVSALGYFVDIYDLILFSIVRVSSLKDLGVPNDRLLSDGVLLINMQMAGMLVGGILWGILGDKKGRLSVLFGSILMYSIANFLNAQADSVFSYAVYRFIAGVGLAGELGAGITLVSEVLPKKIRGFGTTIVASFGICGALLAALIAENFSWRAAYYFGGFMGIALLVLRVSVFESGLFEKLKSTEIVRGNFLCLFSTKARFKKYLSCILIGVPIWFVIGVLITFSPEFAKELGVIETVLPSRAVMYSYAGLAVGDLLSGVLSQYLASRRKAVALFLSLTAVFILIYLMGRAYSLGQFYLICFALGVGIGYWAVFVTIGAEQFGTNLRATVATTVPNFVRGSVVPLSTCFLALKGSIGTIHAALIIGIGCLIIAFWGLNNLEETFDRDMGFIE